MKTFLKLLAVLILLPLLYVGGNLLYGTLTDFSPPDMESVAVTNARQELPDSVISLISWNMGYAGLGQESDFFYDGGTTVRMPEKVVQKNLNGILGTIRELDTVDVFMIQEIDTLAKRSWRVNQHHRVSDVLPDHSAAFTLNYNVHFVPIPFLDPMGRVMAGLGTYSRFASSATNRHQFPSSFPWPNSIYFLDRCFLEQRIPLSSGKELVILNTHNSAYDEDGTLKAAELGMLRTFLENEERQGNFVIVGGDWNQGAPGTGFREVDPEFMPGWQWAYDTSFGTNRDLKAAYVAGQTDTFVIDFFLVSPGLRVEEVRVLNRDFRHSDHQPVYLRVRLKP
jgi:endonuclease/exonuclease/phosphatase family metal-dependent hydrolase